MATKMMVDGARQPVKKAAVKAPVKAPAKPVSKPAPFQNKFTAAAQSAPVQVAATKRLAAPVNAIQQQARAAAPAPVTWQDPGSGGGFDMGGPSADQLATVAADPAEVARQAAARAAVDYKVDPEYLAAKGAYDNVYDQLMATINRENSVYDQDLVKANENMGWRGADKGGWDFQNGDTAAGRGMKNLTDDYAARGMLRGSGFGEAQNSFQTSLQKQLDQLTAQQNEYKGAQTEKLTQADTSRNQSVNMAAAQALARLTQLYTGA
jgi:hypothetical protein